MLQVRCWQPYHRCVAAMPEQEEADLTGWTGMQQPCCLMLVGDELISPGRGSQGKLAHPVADWMAAHEHGWLDRLQQQLPHKGLAVQMPLLMLRRGHRQPPSATVQS